MHGDQAELRRVGDGGVKVVHSGEAASERVNTLVSVCLSTRGPAKFISACSSAEITKVAKSSFPICHLRQRAKLCRPRNCRISRTWRARGIQSSPVPQR